LTNSAAAGQFTGILNETNAKTVLRLLESRKGVETLAEPEVITTSGRQTQMRATQIITVITNMAYVESLTNGPGSIVPQMEQVETGPILDVVPYVLSDGYTINLTVIPSLTEFLGYDKPPDEHFSKYDTRVQLPAVLPKFSVRQVTAALNLWDGQTVVVGGLSEKNYVNGKLSVEKSNANEKELLVLITATIVDPAGNRIHSDGEMPFAKAGIPPQPPHE
jgi:Flp pilus assembly secretin CpaC